MIKFEAFLFLLFTKKAFTKIEKGALELKSIGRVAQTIDLKLSHVCNINSFIFFHRVCRKEKQAEIGIFRLKTNI